MPEYGRWMLEGTPKKPFEGLTALLRVEDHMRLRRSRLLSVLEPDEVVPTMAVFPLLGVGEFWHLEEEDSTNTSPRPSKNVEEGSFLSQQNGIVVPSGGTPLETVLSEGGEQLGGGVGGVVGGPGDVVGRPPSSRGNTLKIFPGGPNAQSLFVPDEITYPHARFGTLTRNIRQRRGEKVAIERPKFVDEFTNLSTTSSTSANFSQQNSAAANSTTSGTPPFGNSNNTTSGPTPGPSLLAAASSLGQHSGSRNSLRDSAEISPLPGQRTPGAAHVGTSGASSSGRRPNAGVPRTVEEADRGAKVFWFLEN